MEKTAKPTQNLPVATQRFVWLVTGVVALVLGYLMLLRAFDTGSLQQYFVVLVALIVAINRFVKAIRGHNHAKN